MANLATELAYLVLRQASDVADASNGTSTAEAASDDSEASGGQCDTGNEYGGRMGVRISAIFVILVGSFLGAWFPTFAARHRGIGVPEWAFFIAKFFGSGVIIATAFIHLLAPANEALTDPCLTGPITEYSWVEGIALMTVFVLFFVELMVMRYAKFGHSHGEEHEHEQEHDSRETSQDTVESKAMESDDKPADNPDFEMQPRPSAVGPHARGENHLAHAGKHVDNEDVDDDWAEHQGHKHQVISPESYSAQLTAIFILEFGVIFHSIFVGLTLAVSSRSEFPTLYVVLVFHQTFEGLGLGSRLASIPWPQAKKWTPYLLAMGYAISTPIAIAIGLGVNETFAPGSHTTLIVNGVFDSISAGILIYTGLVELMAHEFMFSNYMQKASIKTVLAAFFTMCMGAGLMALLGKWA